MEELIHSRGDYLRMCKRLKIKQEENNDGK